MIIKTVLAGVTAALLLSGASFAQPADQAAPGDAAMQPLGSPTRAGTPYSDSGGGLPRDPSNVPMNSSRSAGQHGYDSAARTSDMRGAKRMERCRAMSHDAMMEDSTCRAMMKNHPDMMNDGMAPQ